jgi:hypothetical protein
MVSRRTVLKVPASFCAVSLAGCTELNRAVGCRLNNDYDILELDPVSEEVATSPDSIVVQYENLGPAAQSAVEKAVTSDDEYRECHRFDDGQTGIEKLFGAIEAKWSEAGVQDAGERTYLHYDGTYYGIVLATLDMVQVSSTQE